MKRVIILICMLLVSIGNAQMMDMKKDQMMGHQHGDMMMKDGMRGMNMDMMDDNIGMCLENAEKIGLTEEQKSKIIPIHREMMKLNARFKADIKIAEIELMEVMEPKDFDLDKAILATKKISDIRSSHHIEMLKAMKKVRTILTDEQYKKMRDIMMSKKSMMKDKTKKMMPKKEKK
ncbi:MAG: Spy/CpxP family protein refolding chaperone [Proteobacteria bacterium]|nr:Spy/CpxP family protein refolding chaperone [Pseudomonadota bacterium]